MMKKANRILSMFLSCVLIFGIFTGTKASAATKIKSENEITKTELAQAALSALSCVDKDMNDFEKAYKIHDYLILNTAYDEKNYDRNTIPSVDYTAEGILVNHTGVCEGYAKAYQALMVMLGIPTITVTGDNHMWNMVKLGGNWYHVDVTWDDPVPDEEGRTDYEYFLVSDEVIRHVNSHGSWTSEDVSTPPKATDTQFDSRSTADDSWEDNLWDGYSHEDFNKLETPVTAAVSLDTSAYKGSVGKKYICLAKSNLNEVLFAKADDNSVVKVGEPTYNEKSKGWLVPITGLKSGSTSVTVLSACGATASFPVTIA